MERNGAMIPAAVPKRAIRRDHLNRESISLFVQPDNLCGNPLTALKREDADRGHVCFVKPIWSKVSLCVIGREIAPCEFLVEHLLGFRCEAAFRSKLQEFRVAEGLIVFVELFCMGHGIDPIIDLAKSVPTRLEVPSGVGKPEVARRGILWGALICLWVSQAGSGQITNICSHFVVTKTLKPASLLAICHNFWVADKPLTMQSALLGWIWRGRNIQIDKCCRAVRKKRGVAVPVRCGVLRTA